MIAGMAELPLTAPYGEQYQYSNQMVAAGGFAAAVADGGSPTTSATPTRSRCGSGCSTRSACRTRRWPSPTCSLATITRRPHGADITGALHPLPLLEDDTWLVSVAPSGALWSSAREMARYVQTELGRGVAPDGVRVVSAANLERTWQPGVAFQSAPERRRRWPPSPGTTAWAGSSAPTAGSG